MTWEIYFTPTAQAMLSRVSDRKIREKIVERIDQLKKEPDKQGKPLIEELAGFRSIRAVGQRYRIIYRVEKSRVVVLVVAVGLRQHKERHDVYALAKKLLRSGLLD